MYFTIAVHFFDENDVYEQVPRRQLRDSSNVLEMTTTQFERNFHVSKDIFLLLLGVLKDKWTPAFRSTQIRQDIKLATFLRFVATGSYQKTVGNESVTSAAKSSVGRIIAECLQLFEDFICPQWIQMPRPEEECKIMEAFLDSTGFPGVIGCVDGTHIRIKCPGDDIKHLYYNKNGYCSINAMVACDHKMRIIFVDAMQPGANHDTFIWEQSVLDQSLQNDFDSGKRNVWLLGDGGYKLKPFLITPFKSPKDDVEKMFNKTHASAWNVMESCFSVLKNRFQCIASIRGLQYGHEKATQIINACCALHNICIRYKCSEVSNLASEVQDESTSTSDEEQWDEVDDRAVAIRRGIAINL